VVIAAEPKLADRLDISGRQTRLEFDFPRSEHTGRRRDNDGASRQGAAARFYLDQRGVPLDLRYWTVELNARTNRELAQQLPDSLRARRSQRAVGGISEVYR
jgi:hypothetical protein